MARHVIAVYGAAGHTGRFVVRELARRGCRVIPVRRAAPDPAATAAVPPASEWRYAAVEDADALDAALAGACAVVNCAGPFLDTAPAVVEAALRRGIHYFDIAAEQRSARITLATYSEEARRVGVVVVPAMAFFGGLADLLATEAVGDAREIHSIVIGVALDSWQPTFGTRRTGERNTARRLIVARGALTPQPSPPPTGHWRFPAPVGRQPVVGVPFSEIITISRHVPAASVRSYLNAAPLRELRDPATPPPLASDAAGRSSQRFLMDVVATTSRGTTRLVASGQDIYAVSAPLVVEACMRVLAMPTAVGGGFAPGEIFDTAHFLDALAPAISVRRLDGTDTLEAA